MNPADQPLLRVSGLSKSFPIREWGAFDSLREMSRRAREILLPASTPKRQERFPVLHDISFALTAGEIVGVVGRNGVGKSTLLRLIERTLLPTSGSVASRARVFSMTDLTSGLDPNGSINTNLRLIAALSGVSGRDYPTVRQRAADLANFEYPFETRLDAIPSGLFTHLAVCLSRAIGPHVLIADEILATASQAFRDRFEQLIAQYRGSESAVFFVSHDVDAVMRLCSRALWIEKGSLRADGLPDDIVAAYTHLGPPKEPRPAASLGVELAKVEVSRQSELPEQYVVGKLLLARPDVSATLELELSAGDVPLANIICPARYSAIMTPEVEFRIRLPLSELAVQPDHVTILVHGKQARARQTIEAARWRLPLDKGQGGSGGPLLARAPGRWSTSSALRP